MMDVWSTQISKISNREPVLTDEEFNLFRDLIRKEFGVQLKRDRILTFHTKLVHRLCILGYSTYREYYNYVVSESSKKELFNIATHILNNETYFMREKNQIDVFVSILRDIKYRKTKRNQHEIKILTAGCSTGEEAYTINIAIVESGLFSWGWDVNITGIDISEMAIKRAKNAIYTKNSFRMLDGNEALIRRYFNVEDNRYILRGPYRKNVEFIQGNILDESLFKNMPELDVIFCRNVMIYMTDDSIKKVTQNFYNTIADSGYLFLGTSESLLQKTDLFIPELIEGIIVYRKNPVKG